MTGWRMLHQSRRALKRVMTWSLLYRVNGDPVYRDRAIEEMESMAAFSDWNPRHFFDVGEMALAMAIGTDWLWDDLTEDQRERFLTAIKEKAIEPSLDETHPDNWWMYYYNNWNPVCHSGLIAGALMLAEREPQLAEAMIRRGIRAFPATLDSYRPAGAYPEGPIYWDYGTVFSTIILDLLQTSFGTTFGLDDDPAFRASATYRAMVLTPTGKFYNYADCNETDRFSIASTWFAREYGNAAARYEMARGLESFLHANEWDSEDSNNRLLPLVALWYPETGDGNELSISNLPKVWLGSGPNPVALVREKWNDPESFFLGFKGNDGSVSHAHQDGGSFIFEDEGIRWAVDLGSQGYNSVESLGFGLWDRRQHSDRWRVFRIGPYSHNIVLVDQRPQDVTTKADIVRLETCGDSIHGTVDLSPVYPGQAENYQRRFIVHDYKVLQVVDEIQCTRKHTGRQGTAPASLRWRMMTRAVVTVENDTAVLKQDGKILHLKVTQPGKFILRASPADPPPYFWDEPNPGITAIDLWTQSDEDGNQSINILMSTDKEALDKLSRTASDH
jgi:hypothetical protein